MNIGQDTAIEDHPTRSVADQATWSEDGNDGRDGGGEAVRAWSGGQHITFGTVQYFSSTLHVTRSCILHASYVCNIT